MKLSSCVNHSMKPIIHIIVSPPRVKIINKTRTVIFDKATGNKPCTC